MPKAIKAHQRYRLRANKDFPKGEIVPGVTTICRQLGWGTDALIAWARREALKGNDPDKMRDDAADTGTVTHLLVQAHIEGKEADLSDYTQNQIDKGETGFLAFLEWEKNNKLKYLGSEIGVVSEKYRYGGTIDAIAQNGDKIWLLDFKTGSGVWPEHKIQVSAYRGAYTEANLLGRIDECYILHLNKETGIPVPYRIAPEQLEIGWQVFLRCRELYDYQKQLK